MREDCHVVSVADGTSTFTIELPQGVLEPLAPTPEEAARERWERREASGSDRGERRGQTGSVGVGTRFSFLCDSSHLFDL